MLTSLTEHGLDHRTADVVFVILQTGAPADLERTLLDVAGLRSTIADVDTAVVIAADDQAAAERVLARTPVPGCVVARASSDPWEAMGEASSEYSSRYTFFMTAGELVDVDALSECTGVAVVDAVGPLVTEELERRGLRIGDQEGVHPATVFEGPNVFYAGVRDSRPCRYGAFTYSHSALTEAVVEVGRYCSIASGVVFGEGEHSLSALTTSWVAFGDGYDWSFWLERTGKNYSRTHHPWEHWQRPIRIGHDVWIGARAYIKGGVTLGTGSVVGTSAVVTKDVPPYAIVGGNPARVIRYRFPEDVIERLIASAWWDHSAEDFDGVDLEDVDAAIAGLERKRSQGLLPPILVNDRPWKEIVEEVGAAAVRNAVPWRRDAALANQH